MFISRVTLFAFKNWKIASRYGFASGVFAYPIHLINTNVGPTTHPYYTKFGPVFTLLRYSKSSEVVTLLY